MFDLSRDQSRQQFVNAWGNYLQKLPLEPHQLLLVRVLEMHPEYHSRLKDEEFLRREYDGTDGQTNPFLHMAMHIAIHEQLQTGLPRSIGKIHAALVRRLGDSHAAEHRMLECLGETLWLAQQAKREPDMEHYLECLKKAAQTVR